VSDMEYEFAYEDGSDFDPFLMSVGDGAITVYPRSKD